MTTPQSDPAADAPSLKRTPLFAEHVALGGRMVEFGGWEMPVQYSGIVDEHRAVRTTAGLFDVSHMGEFAVEGPGALDFLQSLVPNNVAKLAENQALYSQICRENGGTIDDLLIYHLGPDRYMVVVNAGTMEKDWGWFSQHAAGKADLMLANRSAETALIALQGPRALAILAPLTGAPLDDIVYYHCTPGTVAGIDCIISRTGYTGEDGFELYTSSENAVALWRKLLAAGKEHGLLPAGLGARDTLRLEAGYCLYGHELDETTNPLEAGLGWTVKLNKGDFIGHDALAAIKAQGLKRKLMGIEMIERGVPRGGYAIFDNDRQIGALTSGAPSPALGKNIGMGYVEIADAVPGKAVQVDIRGKPTAAQIAALPFYKRPKT
jgi:aminomethyltransferase